MKNNSLNIFKEKIFTIISNFFKMLFSRNKRLMLKTPIDKPIPHSPSKDLFLQNIKIDENEEEKRLKALQLQYDNGQIVEEDISDEDMDKLIALYEKETEELNLDTERRKIHISQMLKESKQS